MSLLLPDYSSSSDDEAPLLMAKSNKEALLPSNEPSFVSVHAVEPPKPSPAEPLPATQKKKMVKKKKARKPKTTLYLPPEIQRLLESGTLGDSDDDEDADLNSDSLLAKQKRAVAKRPRADANNSEPRSGTSLAFLPSPKHQLEEPKPKQVDVAAAAVGHVHATETASAAPAEAQAGSADAAGEAYNATAYQQYYQQYDPQQYTQYYQQQQEYYVQQQQQEEEQPEPTSKRARHRDRELERMLQMGQFDSVADKIVEVQAPVPDAWQAPPVEQLKKGSASDVKVKASFWNSSAGTAVASVKPSRLQRQKHQLNQLAFDAKAREFDLLDRKGAAIKTKRETHAKYGW